MKNSVCFHKKSCQTIVALPQTTVWQSPIIYLFLCEPSDRIKKIDPQKDRHNRGDRAQHDKLSRQLAIAAHILRHRIGRRRNRSRVHFKVNKTFHTGKAEQRRNRQNHCRQDHHLEGYRRNHIFQIAADRIEMQRSAQYEQRQRCCQIGKLLDRSFHGNRKFNP